MKNGFVSMAALLATTAMASAQVAENSTLQQQIMQADHILFEDGFNQCKMGEVDAIVAQDFRFLHDQNGFQARAAFLKGFQDSICSDPAHKPIRKPVAGSIAIFPLYNQGKLYGALETGQHDFFIAEPGKPLYQTSTGRFTNVWQQTSKGWQLSESLSYDHHGPKPTDMFDAAYPAPLFDDRAKITALMAQHAIPSMAIARIASGKIVSVQAFGRYDDGRPVPDNVIYNVASLTKPVTALTALKLVAAGKWSLDTPLSQFYVDPDVAGSPELKYLTTRMVLTQRSGFPNWRYQAPSKKLRFEFKPGTRFQYSGEGFEYLRKALEAKFHKGLEALAEENVFIPLGMKDTHYSFASPVDTARYAPPHDAQGKVIDLPHHRTVNAAANLLTTAPDYARLMAALAGGAGLPKALYQDMLTPQAHKAADVDWGLGWGLYENLGPDRVTALQHTGGDDGIKAIAVLLPGSGDGLLVIANGENGLSLWKKILEESFGAVGRDLVTRNLGTP